VNNFRTLSNAEKIAEIGKYTRRTEIELAEEYKLALAEDNRAVIDEFESFGNSLRKIVENKARYILAASVYGFTEKHFNEHGWIDGFTFMDCETVKFELKAHVIGWNSITTGRSPNGKWTYGLNLSLTKIDKKWV
jgi:hypothetical protein